MAGGAMGVEATMLQCRQNKRSSTAEPLAIVEPSLEAVVGRRSR